MNAINVQKYWMVHCSEFGPTNYKHATLESAMAEAERLAKRHPGFAFIVLESIKACCKTDVDWLDFDDEKPF